MLTAVAVAALLGISRSKVYELARSGRLPMYRIDDAVRFDPADVEAFRASCRSTVIAKRVAGFSTSTAELRGSESDSESAFRKLGIEPRLTPTIGRKQRASTPSPRASKNLRLVSSEQ